MAHLPDSVLRDVALMLLALTLFIFSVVQLCGRSSTDSLSRCLKGSLCPCSQKLGGGVSGHTSSISKRGHSLPQITVIHSSIKHAVFRGSLRGAWDPVDLVEWGTRCLLSAAQTAWGQSLPSSWPRRYHWPEELLGSINALKSAGWNPGEIPSCHSCSSWSFT